MCLFENTKQLFTLMRQLSSKKTLYCFSEQASAPRGFGKVLWAYFGFTSLAHRGLITAKTTLGCAISAETSLGLLASSFIIFQEKSHENWSSALTDISKSRNVLLSIGDPALFSVAEKASSLSRL